MEPRGNLYRILEKYRNIEDYLEASEGEMNEAVLKDLEILDDNKDEAIANVFYMLMEKDDEIDLLATRIKTLQDLKEKKLRTANSIKKLLTFTLKMFGNTKVDEFNLSLSDSQSINAEPLQAEIDRLDFGEAEADIVNQLEEAFPNIDYRLFRMKIIVEPAKDEVKKVIKTGKQVDGCALITKQNLRIK